MKDEKQLSQKDWDKLVLKKRKSGFNQSYKTYKPDRVSSFDRLPEVFYPKLSL